MASEKMIGPLNKQINAELYSAYLYTAMSSYCACEGISGVARWMFVQAQEEMTHALRIYTYVNSVGHHAVLDTIERPPDTFESVSDVFRKTLEHERKVTAMINALVDLAIEEKDHATEAFLQWFVTEQVEEEEGVNDILAKLKLAGDSGGGLFMIDKELGARAFTMPADMAQGA